MAYSQGTLRNNAGNVLSFCITALKTLAPAEIRQGAVAPTEDRGPQSLCSHIMITVTVLMFILTSELLDTKHYS